MDLDIILPGVPVVVAVAVVAAPLTRMFPSDEKNLAAGDPGDRGCGSGMNGMSLLQSHTHMHAVHSHSE
jgi:hypothetical protein